jgi:hypothetical protein
MVSWSEFEKLPESPERNFEVLCRALIWLHYGRYGKLAALANQPGVEFHLLLQCDCALGVRDQWFGWQCRWYGLPSGKALGNTRRKKIEDALSKTTKVLPGLTDWVLWTRHPLVKSDQNWFFGLKTKMRLHLWNSANVEALLSGDAEILRRTYFGELLLTTAALAQQHELSVAPIRKRWLPEVHQTIDAERTLRRMLGEAASWDEMAIVAQRLLTAIAVINKEPRALAGRLSSLASTFTKAAQIFAETLQDVHCLLGTGDLVLVRQRLEPRPRSVSRDIEAAPRCLRGARLACGLNATNALADMRVGIQLLDEVDGFLGARLVGVLGDAGGGKTQLAAQLTAALSDRPAGILIHGRELHSGRNLNDLAKTICIQGVPVPSMEALLAAIDAAGQRACRRLPVVIDGLNEAEDPREWKASLAALDILLRRFANVLVICTVRTGARRPAEQDWPAQEIEETPARADFAKQALPDDVRQIEIRDFGGNTVEAIRKYFRYFRINPGDAEVPFELLSHPLTLRIFCEVTNAERKREVGIEAMPGSLTGLFERYLDHAIERIGELAPRNHRYFEHDIRTVFDVIGTELWEEGDRELPEPELRKAIGDDIRPWNESIIHMLEQEGVILRIPGKAPGQQSVIPVYDALGGYLIANAILAKRGRVGLEPWLREPATIGALNGNVANCHPLAIDIFRALVGLLPRRLRRQQLWQLVDEPLRTTALQMAAALEGSYLDASTVTAIADLVRKAQPGSETMFLRLLRTRAATGHPLNAEFLDSVLRSMPVGERDLHWTEWVRENREEILKNLQQLEERWQGNLTARTVSDRLRAKWIMWLLTTTAHNLRDRATRAIYWFGRGGPTALFEQAEGAADINDPYVFERMLAASYGVAMAAHCDPRQPSFRKTVLPEHARRIYDLMFTQDAVGRTTHVLTREYGRRFIEMALFHNRKLLSAEELARVRPPYSDGGRIAWQEAEIGADVVHGMGSPFRMDFVNYTLGRLVEHRRNYDFTHPDYRKVCAQVSWRVQQLGWTSEKFQQVDRLIEEDRHHFGRVRAEYDKVDRYGKKYSWIAYCELAGWLKDQGLHQRREDDGRTWDVDIDPSFPSPSPTHQVVTADLLSDSHLSLAEWIKKGPTPDLTPYLRQSTILGASGPWVALDGFVVQEDELRGRRLFVYVRSFLVAKNQAKAFAAILTEQPLGGGWLPEKPESHYTFAGEVPWCRTFPKTEAVDLELVVDDRNVKGGRECIQTLRPFIPVVDFGWEGRKVDNIPIHGITLAKQFAQTAALVHLPQTYDLQTKEGIRATYGIALRSNDFNNSEHFFFIRENILRTLLKKRGLSLVWAFWGERELSNKHTARATPDGDLAGLSYADFQAVHRF